MANVATFSSTLSSNGTNTAINSTPNYFQFFIESFNYFRCNIFEFILNRNNVASKYFTTNGKFYADFQFIIGQIYFIDIYLVIGLGIFLTLARHLMTRHLFVPITKYCGINRSDAAKIPESAWKLCFYGLTWLACFYYLFCIKNGEYFHDPATVWSEYSIHNRIDSFVYGIYVTEIGFYLHSLYTTLFVDQRRKDTNTLMFHHVLCIFLMLISYSNKSHKSGLLTLFLHDGCDILLESTKLIRYFKIQHGRTYEMAEIFVNIGFVCFLITWLFNRLYWFPLKIIYMASIYVEQKQLQIPFINVLVVMLWIILLMNFYWYTFALRLLYKVATSQIDKLEDNREFDDGKQEVNLEHFKANSSERYRNKKLMINEKQKKFADEDENFETNANDDDNVPLSNVDQVARRRLKTSTIVDEEEVSDRTIDADEGSNFTSVYNLRQRKR